MSRTLLDRFVAYQQSCTVVQLVAATTQTWQGWPDLVDQVRRAAVSVRLNLAEGTGFPPASRRREHHYRIAWASALELEAALDTALELALDGAPLAATRQAAGRTSALLTALIKP